MKKGMEGSGGDLADVVRAAAAAASSAAGLPDWPFVPSSDMASFTSDLADRDFGDPFSFTGDPLLLHNADPDPSGFFYDSDVVRDGNLDQETGRDEKEVGHDDQIVIKPTAGIFSSFLEIPLRDPKLQPVKPPPAVGPIRVLKTPAFLSNNTNNNNGDDNMNSNSSRTLISMGGGDMQISSPQNTGNKRRKCQARKVVCIPAPAPANSRASGEVVPSDLWAWRKYGQKPIKGSPYPRGYYRCSSSKGCSARKQVERSRADPNMLVITYTSDHNHPWPTHRNALAGSTRSQPSKTTTTTITKALPTHSGPQNETESPAHHPKPNIKHEMSCLRPESSNEFFEDDGGILGLTVSEDSFFADLGEIESEPLDELFARGFHSASKDFEPFGFYDWAADESNMTAAPAAASVDDNNVGDS